MPDNPGDHRAECTARLVRTILYNIESVRQWLLSKER